MSIIMVIIPHSEILGNLHIAVKNKEKMDCFSKNFRK